MDLINGTLLKYGLITMLEKAHKNKDWKIIEELITELKNVPTPHTRTTSMMRDPVMIRIENLRLSCVKKLNKGAVIVHSHNLEKILHVPINNVEKSKKQSKILVSAKIVCDGKNAKRNGFI